MKIKITDKACGLEVGKEYDLCDMSATNLIRKRQAVLVKPKEPEKPAPKKEDEPKEKPVTKKTAKRKKK